MLSSRPSKPTALRWSQVRQLIIGRRVGTVSTAIVLAFSAASAWPAYFTSALGSALAGPSDCDDCFEQVLFGPGQTINYFGQTYDGLFVGSNGYVTFGSGLSDWVPQPLLPRFAPAMIAAVWTDLDTREDTTSNVFVNTSTPGQIVVTWDGSGHYPQDYSVRSFAQLVVRSSQFAVPAGRVRSDFSTVQLPIRILPSPGSAMATRPLTTATRNPIPVRLQTYRIESSGSRHRR